MRILLVFGESCKVNTLILNLYKGFSEKMSVKRYFMSLNGTIL